MVGLASAGSGVAVGSGVGVAVGCGVEVGAAVGCGVSAAIVTMVVAFYFGTQTEGKNNGK